MMKENVIGNATEELYRFFGMLNDKYFNSQLVPPMITIQKSSKSSLGHFTLDKIWVDKKDSDNEELSRFEINLNALHLNRDIHDIIVTLEHELVHYACKVSGIKDCDSKIHNDEFKKMAEQVGLVCKKYSKRIGWSNTTASDEFTEFIDNEIKPDTTVFEYFMQLPKKEKVKRAKNTFKYTCPECGAVAKAKRDVPIMCGKCQCDMIMEDEED